MVVVGVVVVVVVAAVVVGGAWAGVVQLKSIPMLCLV